MLTRQYPRYLAAVLALTLCLTFAGAARADAVYDKAVKSTGFVVTTKNNQPAGYGTCWVVDAQKRLVITNQHVVREGDTCFVAFPRFDGDQVVTDSGAYRGSDYIKGKVLARDSGRDLALVELERIPDGVPALELAQKPLTPDQEIWAVGNSGMAQKPIHGGTLWRGRHGTVKQTLFLKTVLKGINQELLVCMLHTDSGAMPGDSGGPLVNAEGQLVGVNSCTSDKGDFAVDVTEVRTFLKNALEVNQTPAHPAVGTWTVTWTHNGRSNVASLRVGEDGTAEWVGVKRFPGTATYQDGKLKLILPGSGINATVDVTVVNDNQFTFSIRFSDATLEFTATRR
jgi:S1-C subfamily serine protease